MLGLSWTSDGMGPMLRLASHGNDDAARTLNYGQNSNNIFGLEGVKESMDEHTHSPIYSEDLRIKNVSRSV